ncbi:MAG: RNA repair transcriptional activator RtcR [Pseudomonadales bacterium]|nr:RNA repair transcriptional activator RtcR [Pseudomonadales bacterium]
MAKKIVVFGLLGTVMDRASRRRGRWEKRWDKWRPTVSLFQQHDVGINKLVLLYNQAELDLAKDIAADIEALSPDTNIELASLTFDSPWDLASVYLTLSSYLKSYNFKRSKEDYYFHITTGSHIQQICVFLVTEARLFPGMLLQASPKKNEFDQYPVQTIDLDLSRYDEIASRFKQDHLEGTDYLKAGIQTKNKAFNTMISQLEKVAIHSRASMLITGPTGAGKSRLAKRIYQLKKLRRQVDGPFVEVNCATLRGDNAMSALFGHKKGAYTDAAHAREGLLKAADGGLLFLDEIGELGLDEQAMLLKAIEDGRFLPLGADAEISSDFQLIAGTNKDLRESVTAGTFREDLLARINLWIYDLPGLKDRIEDLEPNLDHELQQYERDYGLHVTFNREARKAYLEFAASKAALWTGNFRDLNASVIRMATLCEGGRITLKEVKEEIKTLQYRWQGSKFSSSNNSSLQPSTELAPYLAKAEVDMLDLIEQIELTCVIDVCLSSKSAADAGRKLYNVSRTLKKSVNDSHRLTVFLKKHGLTFDKIHTIANSGMLDS